MYLSRINKKLTYTSSVIKPTTINVLMLLVHID